MIVNHPASSRSSPYRVRTPPWISMVLENDTASFSEDPNPTYGDPTHGKIMSRPKHPHDSEMIFIQCGSATDQSFHGIGRRATASGRLRMANCRCVVPDAQPCNTHTEITPGTPWQAVSGTMDVQDASIPAIHRCHT